MPIPSSIKMCRPVLGALKDGSARHVGDVIEFVARHFQLTDEERAIMQPSGRQRLYYNRAAWACTYLFKAGLIARPSRAMCKITESGLEALENGPDVIDNKYLMQFGGYRDFCNK